MDRQPPETTDRYTVKSVARALKLISIVADGPVDGLNLSELASTLGASKSTTLAIARTLVSAGYLSDARPGPRYCLGTNLVRLGDLANQRTPLGEMCRPVLIVLANETQMTARVALNDGGYPVFIDRVDGPGSVRFYTPLGQREVPYASAAGKAILATLPDHRVKEICAETGMIARTSHTITDIDALTDNLSLVRQRGFAIDDEEDAEGIFCASAPFFDHAHRCVGALSVTAIKGDLPSWKVETIGEHVKNYANQITQSLDGAAYEEYIKSH